LARVKLFWRFVSLAFVALMFVVLVPLPWHKVDWGTAPEWIGAIALIVIAVGVWRRDLPPTERRGRLRSRLDVARSLDS
jgi:hypothetical protein